MRKALVSFVTSQRACLQDWALWLTFAETCNKQRRVNDDLFFFSVEPSGVRLETHWVVGKMVVKWTVQNMRLVKVFLLRSLSTRLTSHKVWLSSENATAVSLYGTHELVHLPSGSHDRRSISAPYWPDNYWHIFFFLIDWHDYNFQVIFCDP